jgi:site-specific DNA-methyltransferase (adenine-specific)
MQHNVIIQGDSIEEMKKMKSESIDLIFADPPYWMRTTGILKRVEGTEFKGVHEQWDKFDSNEDYSVFTKKWLTECKRILKRNGSIWIIGGMQCIYTVGGIMQDLGFWFINDVVWHKTNPTPNFMGTRLNNSHETLIWATKNEKSKYTFNYKTAKELNVETISEIEHTKGIRKQMGSVWKFAVSSGNERLKDENGKKLHSTQKPEELLYRIIAISSKIDDVVLDPFGGTMTTGAVAKRMGRKFIMIERDSKYCSFGKARIDKEITQIGNIEKGTYDIKPKRVTMSDMIKDGFFFEGEKFFLKKQSETAELMVDGKLQIRGTRIDMHSGAAILGGLKADRVNGFDYWRVERDGKLVSISEIRENYRRYISKKD